VRAVSDPAPFWKTKPLAAMGLQIDKTDEVTCSIGTTMN